jgi:hypothetical protein
MKSPQPYFFFFIGFSQQTICEVPGQSQGLATLTPSPQTPQVYWLPFAMPFVFVAAFFAAVFFATVFTAAFLVVFLAGVAALAMFLSFLLRVLQPKGFDNSIAKKHLLFYLIQQKKSETICMGVPSNNNAG